MTGQGERPLAELPVLLLDAQATASAATGGALLEIAWSRFSGGESAEPSALEVIAQVVAPPRGATLPPAVARLTGMRSAEWQRGIAPALAWQRLLEIAARTAAPPVPVVVHFARFEEPFLRALHKRNGAGPFPFRLVCTHAIACRLLPELPRRTLRALAGYFGAAVPLLRRSADHVAATGLVWRHLVPLLAEREGVASLASLGEYLAQPAHRAPRRFPLARESRRELPDRPGVYRFLRAGGTVLYVGKATSLRSRVGSHFHAHAGQGERALEMLTQVREVSCAETATALEAALLEADEIKRLAPPYNKALAADGRAVFFAAAGLESVRSKPDAVHCIGPLGSAAPIEALHALRTVLAGNGGPTASGVGRARAVGVDPPWAPPIECFAAGLAVFARTHGRLENEGQVQRFGKALWARRRAASEPKAEPSEPGTEQPAARPPAWDVERVSQALEETVLRAAHAVRRARWLVRISECSVAWAEPGAAMRRLLVIEAGGVAGRSDLAPHAEVPIPPGHARTHADRQLCFDVATFDRLRVLTTELRGLLAEAEGLELRLGPHVRLSRRRLRTVLRWI
jgi:DNA polymerase-3 subunit epsilon